MRAGRLYRHPHCLDVDLYIVKVQYCGIDYIKARVKYWHRSMREFSWPDTQTVKIQRCDLSKWREVTEDGEFV